MNKGDLVLLVQKNLGKDVSKAKAEKSVDAVINGIKNGLKKDKNVQLIGFGTFQVKKRKARTGRNPQTGEVIKIPASKTVTFKCGKALKDSI